MKTSAYSFSALDLNSDIEHSIISTICDWERMEYGEGLHRTPDEFHACVKKNKAGFFVLRDESQLIGYADIWELLPNFYSSLRVGTIDEESLAASSILSQKDSRSSMWYIGSIITNPTLRAERPVAAALAFASICNVLPKFFAVHSNFPARVLGVGSSSFGKRLLTRWGFSPVTRDKDAIDLRPRFEKVMLSSIDANSFYLGRRKV